MTPQEVFDTVYLHLRAQGRPALDRSGDVIPTCAYRSDDGARCAVGCLIPDEIYDRKMEGTDVYTLVVSLKCLPEELTPHVRLLTSLQLAHDEPALVLEQKDWWGAVDLDLRAIAREHRLRVPA